MTESVEREILISRLIVDNERLTEERNTAEANAKLWHHEWEQAQAKNERLTALIRDFLWAIGHDNEKALNETAERARRAQEQKP